MEKKDKYHIIKDILLILMTILSCYFYFSNNSGNYKEELKQLKKSNKSLYSDINRYNSIVDSIKGRNAEIIERNNTLNKELKELNERSLKLKIQHEKDLVILNNLSNSDIAKLFTDKFSTIQ
jgi:seryl-tRNA synthetase